VVPAISQKGENRHSSAVIAPENTAWEPLQPRHCQGETSNPKSLVVGRGSVAPYRSFPLITPSSTGTPDPRARVGYSPGRAVTLAGALAVTSTVIPNMGTALPPIINNQGSSAVSGTFSGLPEGSTVTVTVNRTVMTFRISYVGGTGNDATLTRKS
jgi:hypothetical protein